MQIETLKTELDAVANNFNTLADKITEINAEIKNHSEEINKLTAARTNIENEQRVLQGEYKQLANIIAKFEQEEKEEYSDSEAPTSEKMADTEL